MSAYPSTAAIADRARREAQAQTVVCDLCKMSVFKPNMQKHMQAHHADLLADAEEYLLRQAQTIRDNLTEAEKRISEVGRVLTEVHERLAKPGYGSFGAWVEQEFGAPFLSTAYNLMRVYRRFGNDCATVAQTLGATITYLLAAPSTPPSATEEIMERIGSGEKMTTNEARVTVRAHKAVKEIAETFGVDEPETIALLTTSARNDSDYIREIIPSGGWIQSGDEADATHVTDTPQKVKHAIQQRQQAHIQIANDHKPLNPIQIKPDIGGYVVIARLRLNVADHAAALVIAARLQEIVEETA